MSIWWLIGPLAWAAFGAFLFVNLEYNGFIPRRTSEVLSRCSVPLLGQMTLVALFVVWPIQVLLAIWYCRRVGLEHIGPLED